MFVKTLLTGDSELSQYVRRCQLWQPFIGSDARKRNSHNFRQIEQIIMDHLRKIGVTDGFACQWFEALVSDSCCGAIMSLILSLCPDIDSLSIFIWETDLYYLNYVLSRAADSQLNGPSECSFALSKLRRIDLQFDFGHKEKDIFDCMPFLTLRSLETFTVKHVRPTSWQQLDRDREKLASQSVFASTIIFREVGILGQDLVSFLRCCKNLRKLYYENAIGYRTPNPEHFDAGLSHLKDCLETLIIFERSERHIEPEDCMPLKSLTTFTKLTLLMLPVHMLMEVDANTDEKIKNTKNWFSLLPPTIKTLGLLACRDRSRILSFHLEHFFANYHRLFPKLKVLQLILPCLDPDYSHSMKVLVKRYRLDIIVEFPREFQEPNDMR